MFGCSPAFTIDDIPDQTGRVILVTGGNTGLGKSSIIAFVKKGAKVYMASRTESRALAAIKDIKAVVPGADVTFIPLDLTSFASVSAAADKFLSLESRLHVLLNNAGIMAVPYSETKEGYEIQFGTNHMGHFLLTKKLLPAVERAADESAGSARIVNVASIGHQAAYSGLDLENIKTRLERAMTFERYGWSKLANIMHAKSLAKRYPKIVCVSAHPGVIMSELYGPFLGGSAIMKALLGVVANGPDVGALTQVFCSTSTKVTLADSGEYYVPVATKATDSWWHNKPTKWAKDEEHADKLWAWSEEELGKHGY